MLKKTISNYLAPGIVLIGTSLGMFYQILSLAKTHKRNTAMFGSFSNGIESYIANMVDVWRPRLFSNVLASQVLRISELVLNRLSIPLVKDPIQLGIALYVMGWFLLIGLLIILWAKKRSPFYILGTFACISIGYSPIGDINNFIFPWDMSALFVFSAFIVLYIENKFWWLLVLIPFGVGFKESALILCLIFLFRDLGSSWNPLQKTFWMQFQKESWMLFSLTVILSLVVKGLIGWYVQVPVPLLTVEYTSDYTHNFLVYENAIRLGRLFPFFVNAGTLLALFILPSNDPKVRALKLLALVFVLGNFAFGVITEYRIWFELVPFALYALEKNYAEEAKLEELPVN